MQKTLFENISTGIEPLPGEYGFRVWFRIYNNTYYLNPVETLEEAKTLEASLHIMLGETYLQTFVKKSNEGTKRFVKMFLWVFGFVALYTIVNSLHLFSDEIRLTIVTILIVCSLLPPILVLMKLKPPPLRSLDEVMKIK